MTDSSPDNIPISDRTLDALRTTAAMVATVPELAAIVRVEDQIVLEVRRGPAPADVDHKILPPCAFHGAVAGAHRLRRSGERIGMRGVPAVLEPSIDWGVARGAKTLPGHMIRVERDEMWSHLVPVPVPIDAVVAALDASEEDFRSIGCHPDEALDVTVLHETGAAGDKRAAAGAIDRLVAAITTIGVVDLEERLRSPDEARRS